MEKRKMFSEDKLIFQTTPGGSGPSKAPGAPTTAPKQKAGPSLSKEQKAVKERSKELLDDFKGRFADIDSMRKEKGVVALSWRIDSPEAVESLYKDWADMTLQVNDPHFVKMKAQFLKPFNNNPAEGLKIQGRLANNKPGNLDYYTDPMNPKHYEWLRQNDADYFEALDFFVKIKKDTIQQLESDENTQKALKKLESDERIFPFISDEVTRAAKNFSKAFKDRDYATLALYAFGAWAAYKAYNAVKGKIEGSNSKLKSLAWLLPVGAAGYAGYHIFGGDRLLKKWEVKDKDVDTQGTAFESMSRLDLGGAEGLDAEFLMTMANMSVKDVYAEYLKAGPSGFIPPDRFGELRKRFGVSPSHKPKDINNPLGSSQRNYVEIGRKLFATMHGVVEAYKLIPNQEQTFEQRFIKNPISHDFSSLVGFYRQYLGTSHLDRYRYLGREYGESIDVARDELKEFEGKMAFSITGVTDDKMNAKGYLFGYPVAFLRGPEGKYYEFKFIDHYPEGPAFGRLNLEAGKRSNVGDIGALRQTVEARMIDSLTKVGIQTPIVFDDVRGKWTAEIDVAAIPGLGIKKGRKQTVRFTPMANGNGVFVEYGGVDVPLNFDAANFDINKRYLVNRVRSKYPDIFNPFMEQGGLSIDKLDEASGEFELSFRDVPNSTLLVYYDSAKDQYDIDKATVKHLLKSTTFPDKYAEAMAKSQKVDEAFSDLRAQLERAPEAFLTNFLKELFTEPDIDFSGSIKETQLNAILNAHRDIAQFALAEKVRRYSTDLDDVAGKKNQQYGAMLGRLSKINQAVFELNNKKIATDENWGSAETRELVYKPLTKLSAVTPYYGDHLNGFTDGMYKEFFTASDIWTRDSEVAGKLISTYGFYTSHLDRDFVFADIDWKLLKKTPRSRKEALAKLHAIQADKCIKYFNYVHQRILRYVTIHKDELEAGPIPVPGSSEWGIKDFDDWK